MASGPLGKRDVPLLCERGHCQSESPERGTYPKELLALGIRDYREIFFKPYRVIYQVIGDKAHVLLIVDGRRDRQALLQRRLLEV